MDSSEENVTTMKLLEEGVNLLNEFSVVDGLGRNFNNIIKETVQT